MPCRSLAPSKRSVATVQSGNGQGTPGIRPERPRTGLFYSVVSLLIIGLSYKPGRYGTIHLPTPCRQLHNNMGQLGIYLTPFDKPITDPEMTSAHFVIVG